MLIKNLRVKNYRRISEKSIDFANNFNLIIGDNGSGKTAILDCLSMLTQKIVGEIASKRPNTLKKEDVRVVRYEISGEYSFEQQFPCSIEIDGKFNGLDFSVGETLSLKGRKARFQGKSQFKEMGYAVSSGEFSTALPMIAYYRTNRLWFSGSKDKSDASWIINNNGSRSRLRGYELSSAAALNSRSWVEWFIKREFSSYKTRPSQSNRELFDAVKEIIKLSIDGCSELYYDFNYEDIIAIIDNVAIPYKMLSDGQRGIMSLFADIAFRSVTLNPNVSLHAISDTEGAVFIDEIDLHLHPNWQKNIVRKLKVCFPKIQFFATTHSPFIIQSVLPNEVIQMEDVPHYQEFVNRSIEDIAENVMDVETPQISERRKEMYQVAQRYYLLLEEGKSEEGEEAQILKEKLDQLISPFSNDVAFTAFLNMERLAKMKNGSEKK